MSPFDKNVCSLPEQPKEKARPMPTAPTGSKGRLLDQFYTNDNIALECYSTLKNEVDIHLYDLHLEPSAGNGSFYKLLDPSKAVGIDIDPASFVTGGDLCLRGRYGHLPAASTVGSEARVIASKEMVQDLIEGEEDWLRDTRCRQGIIEMNFFEFEPKEDKKYLVIGNPPFGRSSSTAIKFFNKAAVFSDCIAFILPRTFKRVSVQNRLDLNFSLIYTEDLPLKPCSFTPKMNAKCCFQI